MHTYAYCGFGLLYTVLDNVTVDEDEVGPDERLSLMVERAGHEWDKFFEGLDLQWLYFNEYDYDPDHPNGYWLICPKIFKLEGYDGVESYDVSSITITPQDEERLKKVADFLGIKYEPKVHIAGYNG